MSLAELLTYLLTQQLSSELLESTREGFVSSDFHFPLRKSKKNNNKSLRLSASLESQRNQFDIFDRYDIFFQVSKNTNERKVEIRTQRKCLRTTLNRKLSV